MAEAFEKMPSLFDILAEGARSLNPEARRESTGDGTYLCKSVSICGKSSAIQA
jgi:hypothetical protein